jgi:hypothetical protein
MHPSPTIKLGDWQLAITKEHTECVEAQTGIIIMAKRLRYMEQVIKHDLFLSAFHGTFCHAEGRWDVGPIKPFTAFRQ